jgi:excisionase family DNA binding protein
MDKQLLTVAEVVAVTGLGEATIWRWLRAGRLPRVRIADRTTRIPSEAATALATELSRNDLLTVQQVADLLSCSQATVWRLLHKGELQRTQLSKRGVRVARATVQEYIQRRTR